MICSVEHLDIQQIFQQAMFLCFVISPMVRCAFVWVWPLLLCTPALHEPHQPCHVPIVSQPVSSSNLLLFLLLIPFMCVPTPRLSTCTSFLHQFSLFCVESSLCRQFCLLRDPLLNTVNKSSDIDPLCHRLCSGPKAFHPVTRQSPFI